MNRIDFISKNFSYSRDNHDYKTLSLVTRHAFCLLLFAFCCSLHAQVDTKGTDFWITCGQNGKYTNIDGVDLQIRIVGGEEDATVTVTLTHLNFSFSTPVPAGQVFTYSLPSDEQRQAVYNTATGISNHSLHIRATTPVSVFTLNHNTASTDATNVLPVNALGTDYYHISYTPSANVNTRRSDAYAVIAIQDNTQLYHDNTPTVQLNKGQVYYRTSENDMTGNHITADKPVAYFAMHQGVLIPDGSGATDNLFQQLAPVNTWGKNFFVPATQTGKDIVRIAVSQNGTNITQKGGTVRNVQGGKTTLTGLNAGEWVELEITLANRGCYIQADHPIGVCTYITSGNIGGDPGQAWIPAIEQTAKTALFAPFMYQGIRIDKHYALIVTPTATRNNTRVKTGTATEQPLSGGSWYHNTNAEMSFYSIPLTSEESAYLFTNQAGLIVLAYGVGNAESYYYLASSSMRNLDAAFYVNDIHYQDMDSEVICTQPLRFRAEINGNMSTEAGHLKWYIDDVEEVAARDQLAWEKVLMDGTYRIKMEVITATNLLKTAETTVTVLLSRLDSLKDISLCSGDTFSPVFFSGVNMDTAVTVWEVIEGSGMEIGMNAENGTGHIPAFKVVNSNTPTVSVTIQVTPKTEEGCAGEPVTFSITVNNQISEIDLGKDTVICWLDSLVLNATHPLVTHYQWQDGSSGSTYTVYYDGGEYWVIAKSYCGTASDTINVSYLKEITLNLGNDTAFCEGHLIDRKLDATNPNASYLWQDGSTSPVYTVEEAGTYSVTVSNACISVTDEIEITTINCHLDFNIPNVFTPNGDGINDTFAPEFTPPENVRSFQMSMYDRWGRLVFSTGSYQMSWDGNNKNGKPYAEGVYYCVLYFTDILGQEYTHHCSVTLIR